MVSITTFIIFLSFYLFYNTSKKTVKYDPKKSNIWIDKNIQLTKKTAFILLIISIILNIYLFGFGAGILIFFVILMTLGGLIILLFPMGYLNYKSVFYCFLVFLIFELFIF